MPTETSGATASAQRDQLWTVLAAATVLATFSHLHSSWLLAERASPTLGAVGTFGYVALLVLAVGALAVRTDPGRHRVEVGTLVVAVGIQLLEIPALATRGLVGAVDEGQLTNAAIKTFVAGGSPYATSYAALLTHPTRLMDGHIVDHYDYPPLPLLLGRLGSPLWSGLADIAVLNVLALCLAAVLGFVLLPARLRLVAVLAVLSVGFLNSLAVIGEPIVLALPLLVVATARWTRIGAAGRRGADVVAGACLGLAAADQQLVWFLVPFLAVAVWCLRSGETTHGRAFLRLAPYFGAAGVTLVAANLPLVLRDPSAWWRGVTEVLTQHAMPDGPGLSTLSVDLLHGTGALYYYRWAATALYAALLVGVALAPRRLAVAFAILPMLTFVWQLRSEDSYYLAFAPLWIFLVAATPPGALESARGVGAGSHLRHGVRRVALAAAFVPAVACLVVGLVSRPPLTVQPLSVQERHGVWALAVRVRNNALAPVTPEFKLIEHGRTSGLLHAVGPSRLAAARWGRYVVRGATHDLPGAGARVVVFTDRPETASVGDLRAAARTAGSGP